MVACAAKGLVLFTCFAGLVAPFRLAHAADSGAGSYLQVAAKLVGSNATADARQGVTVAISADGSTLAVGGYRDNNSTGAVWVFTRSGNDWKQQGPKLVGTGGSSNTFQGSAVALSADGSILAVGAYGDSNTGSAWAQGVGATWVFRRSRGKWSQMGPKLVGTGAQGVSGQGIAVALNADGTTLAVGGHYDADYNGATWIFTRSGDTWSQQGGKLVGTGISDYSYQGWAVRTDYYELACLNQHS